VVRALILSATESSTAAWRTCASNTGSLFRSFRWSLACCTNGSIRSKRLHPSTRDGPVYPPGARRAHPFHAAWRLPAVWPKSPASVRQNCNPSEVAAELTASFTTGSGTRCPRGQPSALDHEASSQWCRWANQSRVSGRSISEQLRLVLLPVRWKNGSAGPTAQCRGGG